ncbi:MAG: hypothetical protein SGI90_00975 [Candidatus Eisenbacteria bacterium]|nr:hypothetical protein [Candidatus Eisenbacteria bacterium]
MSMVPRLRPLLFFLTWTSTTETGHAVAADIRGRVEIVRPASHSLHPSPGEPGGLAAELDTLAARIFLRGPEMVTTRRSGPITIQRTIRDGAIVPAFEIIRLGDRVVITNHDSVPRRVFVFAHDRTHLFGPMVPEATASIDVSHFGTVELSTDAPGAVRSLLFVAENPFVARAGPDGRFLMGGVPPGDYRLIAWRPGAFLGERLVQLAYNDSALDAGTIARR